MADGDSNDDPLAGLSDDDKATLANDGVVIEGVDDVDDGDAPSDGAAAAAAAAGADAQQQQSDDDSDADADAGRRQGNVGAALREAREQIAALRTEREADKQFLDQMRAAIAQGRQRREQQQQEEQDPLARIMAGRPDADQDPFAALQWSQNAVVQLVQHIHAERAAAAERAQQGEQQTQQQQQHEAQVNAAIDRADTVLTAAVKMAPDVADAYEFASQAVAQKLQKSGLQGAQLQAAFKNALINYAANAPSDPNDMREYVYANARYWGWGPGMKAGGSTDVRPANDNTRRDPKTGQFMAPADLVRNAAERSKAAATLSGGGNDIGANDDPDVLKTMSGEEIEAFIEANPELANKLLKKLGVA